MKKKQIPTRIPWKCEHCGVPFMVLKSAFSPSMYHSAKYKKHRNMYCSRECVNKAQTTKQTVTCLHCKTIFQKVASACKKSPNHFCCRSCMGFYNNKHKKHGSQRSKLERYIEEHLSQFYPQLRVLYNDRTTIKAELDIYIPLLHLAIELNGIFHYEPIFGEYKLSQTQNNDSRKFQACLEKKIELCIIDTSSLKYFKPANAEKYLKIVTDIIDSKLRDQ